MFVLVFFSVAQAGLSAGAKEDVLRADANLKETREAAGMRELQAGGVQDAQYDSAGQTGSQAADLAGDETRGGVQGKARTDQHAWQTDDQIDGGALRIVAVPTAISAAVRIPITGSTTQDATPFQQEVLGHPSRAQREQCVQQWTDQNARTRYSFNCIHGGEDDSASLITDKAACEQSYMMRHRHMDFSDGDASSPDSDSDCYLQGEVVQCCYDCDTTVCPGSIAGQPEGQPCTPRLDGSGNRVEAARCMPSGVATICPDDAPVLVGCGDAARP